MPWSPLSLRELQNQTGNQGTNAMSLIREALRKEAKETDTPSPLPIEKGRGRIRFGSSKTPKIVVVIYCSSAWPGCLFIFFPQPSCPFKRRGALLPRNPWLKKLKSKHRNRRRTKKKGLPNKQSLIRLCPKVPQQ